MRRIDHVMIKADDPREVFALFTETLGLPLAWPLEERGGVVRVTSLARAKAFPQGNGLLTSESAGDVMLEPSKAFGIRMRFTE